MSATMSKVQVDVDCTRKCRSRSHGQSLTSAITKRSITDVALASYIRRTCANFTQAFDFEGRTALHMTASRGRQDLMEWLVQHSSEAFVNARDRESGYTPLHRSIFYGQIHNAVSLMKIGVKTDIVDKDDYKALEHAMLDRQYMYKHEDTQPCDVYVWGSNSNYTLGTGTQQQKKTPDVLNCFSRTNTSLKQICLGKFHSVWVCGEGGVWACGQVSRAGAGAATALRPQPLRVPEPCARAAITLHATVLLLQSGAIVQYGIRGTEGGPKGPMSGKPLIKLSDALGVCASRGHVLVWNAHAAYTWGANVGQLGHSQPNDKYVDAPKRVAISMNTNTKEEVSLQLAAAADAASLLTTSRGDVYLLHKHYCKKIAVKQINLKQVCVDAKISEQGVYSRVTVLLLTHVGQLLLWQDSTNRLTRCTFGLNHQTVINQVTLTHDAIFFTTKYGEAFAGTFSRKVSVLSPPPAPQPHKKERDSNKSALVKFLEKEDCTSVKITRIPNIHRAVSIDVDNEGLNFACLQIKPTCGLASFPQLSPTCFPKHMESLMETASEDDILHDVIFQIGQKSFPAHIFIVASSSELLYKLYQNEKSMKENEKPTIMLENVHPEVFERILRYMYTGACDVTQPGPCSLRIRKEDLPTIAKKEKNDDNEGNIIENPMEISAFEVYKSQSEGSKKPRPRHKTSNEAPRAPAHCDPVKLVQAAAKRLQVMALHKILDKLYYRDGMVRLKESAGVWSGAPAPAWGREGRVELADTRVSGTSPAALCPPPALPAHRCVLAARLDYFRGMFMHSWSESTTMSTVTLPVNHGILEPIIDFLYTDSCPEVETSDSLDFICSLLVVADQLFITRLREMCEVALANLITLRNCTELCQFAHTYNASQLKQCCMEFISLNISCFLENRSLEILDNTLLVDLTKYYCKFNPIMSSRIITPFCNAADDETINEINKSYPIDLNVVDEEMKTDIIELTKKKSKYSKKIDYTESEKARMRYESVSSVTFLDISNERLGDITLSLSKISKETEGKAVKRDKWIEVPTAQQKQQKIVQARLKAVTSAKDILNENQTESFTKLTKNDSFVASSPPDYHTSTTSRLSVSPKEFPMFDYSPTQGSISISRVGPKMSQKQRKKLASQGEIGHQSLDDYFSNKTVESPIDTTPKNPWKITQVPIACSPKTTKSLEFNQILADQKKQKDDSSRIMTKPLNLTQLEDKAIEELERFYNIHEADDELISVCRIELQVSCPQWVHTVPK